METKEFYGAEAETEARSFAEDVEAQGGTVELIDMDWTADRNRIGKVYWFVQYTEAPEAEDEDEA